MMQLTYCQMIASWVIAARAYCQMIASWVIAAREETHLSLFMSSEAPRRNPHIE
jgi:hypothetical protein